MSCPPGADGKVIVNSSIWLELKLKPEEKEEIFLTTESSLLPFWTLLNYFSMLFGFQKYVHIICLFIFFNLSLLPTHAQLDPSNFSTHPTSFSLSLFPPSLKNLNKQTNPKVKKFKQVKNEQRITEKTWVILCWPTTSELKACTGLWLFCPVSLHWRKLIFFLPAGISCKKIFV